MIKLHLLTRSLGSFLFRRLVFVATAVVLNCGAGTVQETERNPYRTKILDVQHVEELPDPYY